MSTPTDRQRPRADQPTFFELAGDPPPEAEPAPPSRGRPRLRTANREQIVFLAAPLHAISPQAHPARIVGAYVEGLELAPLYDRIKAVERAPGRAPIDPKILMALWLYPTIEGNDSAGQFDNRSRQTES